MLALVLQYSLQNIVHHIRYQHTTANVCVPAQNWNRHGSVVVHWWTSQFNHTMQSSTQFDIHRPQPCTDLSCSRQDLKLIPYSLEASVVSSSSNMLQWCWCLSNVLKSNSLSENCMKFTFAWQHICVVSNRCCMLNDSLYWRCRLAWPCTACSLCELCCLLWTPPKHSWQDCQQTPQQLYHEVSVVTRSRWMCILAPI